MSLWGPRTLSVAAALIAPFTLSAQTSGGTVGVDTASIARIFATVSAPDAPGCAVGIARSAEPVFLRGFGGGALEHGQPLTPTSAFNIGSMAKQFTAMAALLLAQQGTLQLDAPVTRYITEWPASAGAIRVRDLLYHTSGLRDYNTLEVLTDSHVRTMSDFLDLMMRQRGLNFVPGTRQEYSHSDYSVLAAVIERATKAPFADVLQRLLFTPLGMTSTTVHDQRRMPIRERAFAYNVDTDGARTIFPQDELVGGDNVYTTVGDLLRWDRNFTTATVGGADLVRRFTTLATVNVPQPMPYVHGLWLGAYRGLRTVARRGGGGGFSTSYFRVPDAAVTVATLCNTQHHRAELFSHAVIDAMLGAQLATVAPPDTVATPPDEAVQLAGRYRSAEQPWNPVILESRAGRLVEILPDSAAFPLTRLRDGRYATFDYSYTFRQLSGGGMHLTVQYPDGREDLVRQAESPWRPTTVALPSYAGNFVSTELDAMYTVRVAGTRLMLQRSGVREMVLEPLSPDLFAALSGTREAFLLGVRFTRGKDSRIDGFTVGATPKSFESALGIRFAKVNMTQR
ncbi:MAG: beta-lactamase family protein [Gemmatimonadaceae bacterium]|nr:beta-lactamase family protein [Gemmatimonadaceae bacterium]